MRRFSVSQELGNSECLLQHLTVQMREDAQIAPPILLCFCHLRWNFVYQRPQHLMSQWAAISSVHFFEEPAFVETDDAKLSVSKKANGLNVLTPMLPHGLDEQQIIATQRRLLDEYLGSLGTSEFIAWYYTPMALRFSGHLEASIVVYDCMDELSAFQGAPPEMVEQEGRLFEVADVVFAGGKSLYESKRVQHPNVHLFPSSIDQAHFAKARKALPDPDDQRTIPHPRIGFYGVIDERLDTELLKALAALRPDWQFILLGPVVKIREEDLPRSANLHYLGSKDYAELPEYLANWDVAILPFARNASTRFISPTKTPEYLAAGKPVVSTPIQDVVQPYGEMGLVRIGASAEEFAEAIEASLDRRDPAHDRRVDEFLTGMSWGKTFSGMLKEISRCGSGSAAVSVLNGPPGKTRGTVANV
jgi:glycosyltransferase involved in cell wall biosynthesis